MALHLKETFAGIFQDIRDYQNSVTPGFDLHLIAFVVMLKANSFSVETYKYAYESYIDHMIESIKAWPDVTLHHHIEVALECIPMATQVIEALVSKFNIETSIATEYFVNIMWQIDIDTLERREIIFKRS